MPFSFRLLLEQNNQPHGSLDNESKQALLVANGLSRSGPTHGRVRLIEASWFYGSMFYRTFIATIGQEITHLFQITPRSYSRFKVWVVLHAPHRFVSAELVSNSEFRVYYEMRDMPSLIRNCFGSPLETTNYYPYKDNGRSLDAASIDLQIAVHTALSLNNRDYRIEEDICISWQDLAASLDCLGHIRCHRYSVPGCQLYDVDLSVGNGNGSHYLVEVAPDISDNLHAAYIVGYGSDGDLHDLYLPIPNSEETDYC